MIADLPFDTMKARKEWNNTFKVLEGRNKILLNLKSVSFVKIFFENRGKDF